MLIFAPGLDYARAHYICKYPVDICIYPVDICIYPVDICIYPVDICIYPVDICIYPSFDDQLYSDFLPKRHPIEQGDV